MPRSTVTARWPSAPARRRAAALAVAIYSAAAAATVGASPACVSPARTPGATSDGPRVGHTLPTPVAVLASEARAMVARLRRRESPGGVDRVVADLEAAAASEGATARAAEARAAAAELLAARFDQTRDPRDADRAAALLARISAVEGTPAACAALVLAGRLWLTAGNVAAARARYEAYERACPSGPDGAHVHATLALLDPPRTPRALPSARASVSASVSASGDDHGTLAAGSGHVQLRRVVIDPGHGGVDPGARGATGLVESAVTLDVARRLADHLAGALGIDVVLTRDADTFVPLEARAVRANDAGADLFVSIHCNSTENPASHGVATYVLDATNDRVAARVAARENGDLTADPVDRPEVARILANLRLSGQGARSARLAAAIQRSVVTGLTPRFPGVADLGVHRARFHVLVGARMPAVLVELSFLSNPTEERRLRSPAYRDALASAVAGAIAGFDR